MIATSPASTVTLHGQDLRYLDGTLYAVSRDATLSTIDPATGIATLLATPGRFTAIERFDPTSE